MSSETKEKPKIDQPTEPQQEAARPGPVEPPVKPADKPSEKSSEKSSEIKVGTSVPRPMVTSPMVQQIQVPEILPLLPVRGAVAFPGAVMPLTVGRDRSKRVLDEVLPGEKIIGVITQKNENTEDPQPTELYGIGTASLVLKMLRMPEGAPEHYCAWAGAVSRHFGNHGH